MVSGLSLSVLPNLRKGFLCNLYHVIEYDDENGVDDFKFKDASTYEGCLRQNDTLYWFGIEMAK